MHIEQLVTSLDFMQDALRDPEKARFRDFWQMKKTALSLFKQEMPSAARSMLWNRYTSLLAEAHEVQRMVESETNFQIEQIELAITALEQALSQPMEEAAENILLKNVSEKQEKAKYWGALREKALDLRKEVLALEMRISHKNKLLARISSVCDVVCPAHKMVMRELTELFEHEVAELMQKSPKSKEKIKQIQSALKHVVLERVAARRLREQLSLAWSEIA